nr:PDGLE domain-containing protein [Haloquadratum walsbyi]
MISMSMDSWIQRAALMLLGLVIVAPFFGWTASVVGYAEPLENAAKMTGATDAAMNLNPGVLPDYTVGGFSGPIGTLISAGVGTVLTLIVAFGAGRLLES